MALNVVWNWRAPTVGDPNGPANANLAGLQQGTNAIAQGIQRAKEREQNQKQFDDTLALKREQMSNDQAQRQQENLFKNREFWETKRMNDLKEKQVLAELERKKKQDEYLNKMYDQYFSDADQQELAQLLAKYQGKNDATNVMAGLNPQFLNLR